MSGTILSFIPADCLKELHIARAMFGVFAKTDRMLAAAHRRDFESTGNTASLSRAWVCEESAAKHEEVVAEAESVLKALVDSGQAVSEARSTALLQRGRVNRPAPRGADGGKTKKTAVAFSGLSTTSKNFRQTKTNPK